jgi:hypothetical protein
MQASTLVTVTPGHSLYQSQLAPSIHQCRITHSLVLLGTDSIHGCPVLRIYMLGVVVELDTNSGYGDERMLCNVFMLSMF